MHTPCIQFEGVCSLFGHKMGNAVNKVSFLKNDSAGAGKNNSDKKYNILMLGLNGSGKTTLLYHNFIPG
ncbi:ADP-ribosylation factor-like protein, putative [Plasmodium ovale wallikeri]|uniref:ADP-ribosylation factor-like protein, putative n=1 Tax=Plasmodium ovale wallikeri TaxID=864142 RepID=A0A1A8Z0B2_PLAOA|nr:ADP-ribosylation factor-like protein, putative [Plasmodium ovale wallikeri]SBT37849.1 ADP-ribosylation factor-like protein, putative [Plasmodium ovale wallikeri]